MVAFGRPGPKAFIHRTMPQMATLRPWRGGGGDQHRTHPPRQWSREGHPHRHCPPRTAYHPLRDLVAAELPPPSSTSPPPPPYAVTDTTKTRSGPQRVRMCGGERPIGAAKGKQSDAEALCQTPAPTQSCGPRAVTGQRPSAAKHSPHRWYRRRLWVWETKCGGA